MYLRETRQKRADGSLVTHLQLVESVWNPHKKRSEVRILHNCGRAEDPKTAERLRNLARSILKKCDPEAIVQHSAQWRTGKPSRVTASPMTICGASPRPFFDSPRLRGAL